jgi:phosphoheptose isomerase
VSYLADLSHRTRERVTALEQFDAQLATLDCLGRDLGQRLQNGSRLLIAGNGGSAAQAQHLAAELVGRFDQDRQPFSAIALGDAGCLLTALGNDYGARHVFARQVTAHGQPGDVLLAISTSGRSQNLLTAARTATALKMHVWSFTGPGETPLAGLSDRHVRTPTCTLAIAQELHLLAIHVLCEAVEHSVADRGQPGPYP